jgi:hypothetical protein
MGWRGEWLRDEPELVRKCYAARSNLLTGLHAILADETCLQDVPAARDAERTSIAERQRHQPANVLPITE